MKRFLKILAFLLIVAIIIILAAFDNRLKIVNYGIKADNINSTVKLALIADLHNCTYGGNQSELVGAIDNYNPDAVLLAGDIFDDAYINENGNILVDNIAKRYKTYFVSGNHDWWSDKMQEHFKYLKKTGVIVLRGNSDNLTVNDTTIVISGVDDYAVDKYEPSYRRYEKQLEQAASSITPDYYNVLLAHRPENANQYFEHDFDLVLSGHTHGGQIRIPIILNGLWAPEQGYFPKLAGGIYDFDNKKMIVSRGLTRENTELPRIFNRPELVFVTLSGQNDSFISLPRFQKPKDVIYQIKVNVRPFAENFKKLFNLLNVSRYMFTIQ